MHNNVLYWLENTAQMMPDKIAFSDSRSCVTFSVVRNMAKALGTAIASTTDKKKPVAVISERNCYTPIIFLGVVYAGCCYAPIDGKLPTGRINCILNNLDPSVVLVDRANENIVAELDSERKYLVAEELFNTEYDDDILKEISDRSNENDPLYIISTSGSTGVPKGVVTSHHSLMCYIEAYSEVMGIDENDILGNQSPLDYIAAIRDIYLPLLKGCSSVIIPKEFFALPTRLFDYMTEKKITSIGWSVSALTVPISLGAFNHGKPEYLEKICFSGSVMPNKYLQILQEKLPNALLVNQYGPTEATASCTYYKITEKVDDDFVLPIGKAYRNYRVFLLNDDNTPTEGGHEGEICVSGPILAMGYYNDPERTSKSFVQNPLNPYFNELIYKTGDIGVMRPDGNLEFHGRRDRQIKHMGHRVELDEIEAACNKISGVDESCTVYDKENEKINLFFSGSATVKKIAVELRKILPGFMVPRKIIQLDALPKLANGKIDMNILRRYRTIHG